MFFLSLLFLFSCSKTPADNSKSDDIISIEEDIEEFILMKEDIEESLKEELENIFNDVFDEIKIND